MKTIVPIQNLPGQNPAIPRFKIAIPDDIIPDPKHFPIGFIPDFPATATDMFLRDILALNENIKGPFHLYIDLPEYLYDEYAWLPFTLAMHALILAPECNVLFLGMSPVEYSLLIDVGRPPRKVLHCIQNFVMYLHTKDGNRSRRVFEQLPAGSGSFASFDYRIMNEIGRLGFSAYYRSWMESPFMMETYGGITYVTHPFDHLPVKNLTWELKMGYLTASQLKANKLPVPDIGKAVFLHDQMGTVALRPYWGSI